MSVCRGARDLTFQYPCSFRFPLPAGGTTFLVPLASGGRTAPRTVPLAKRGEPTEGGNCELWQRSWYKAVRQSGCGKRRVREPHPYRKSGRGTVPVPL
jgi:hypothetical protein